MNYCMWCNVNDVGTVSQERSLNTVCFSTLQGLFNLLSLVALISMPLWVYPVDEYGNSGLNMAIIWIIYESQYKSLSVYFIILQISVACSWFELVPFLLFLSLVVNAAMLYTTAELRFKKESIYLLIESVSHGQDMT